MIGLFPTKDLAFEAGEVWLEKGDIIVIATDGITDAEDGRGAVFGLEGLIKSLETRLNMSLSADGIVDSILADIDRFVDKTLEQQDDMTILCIRPTG